MWRGLVALAVLMFTVQAAGPRSVSGSVVDKRGNFLPGAVVQIEDTVTLEIQSYIIHGDGEYHFKNLNPDVDYSLHARYRTYLSKGATLSKFDGKTHTRIDFTIPVE